MPNWNEFLSSPGVEPSADPGTEPSTEPSAGPSTEPGTEPAAEPSDALTNDGEPVESASVGGEDPIPPPSVPWPWIISTAALALALIVTLLIIMIRGIKNKKKKKREEKKAKKEAGFVPLEVTHTELSGAAPKVGKLHQQGARSSQQDCFSVSPADLIPTHGLLAVVADGMGGLSDGDKVSQAAVSAMMNGFYTTRGRPEEVLLTLLGQANNEVNRLLGSDGLSKSGSTLVAGLVRDGKFHYLSVGDSRVCLYRGGTLYQLNREHIFRHELEQRAVNGEDNLRTAYSHPRAAGLTSYLGMGKLKYVDIPASPTEVRAGDKFLLMSDGVYNALPQAELTACLNTSAEEAALRLDQAIRAKNYSNQDNYTAVILGY